MAKRPFAADCRKEKSDMHKRFLQTLPNAALWVRVRLENSHPALARNRAITMTEATQPTSNTLQHKPYEDVQALLSGSLLTAVGVLLFAQAGFLTGGITGLAFLVHYATGWHLGLVLFVLNLPFYGLAWRGMGRAFTYKTFAAVALLAVFVHNLPHWLSFAHVAPPLSAVLGGLLIGVGMLVLFRHRASLGGFGVLALYLQQRLNWRAGFVQMGLDALILLSALALMDTASVAWSVLGAWVLNQTVAINHRPGRYMNL